MSGEVWTECNLEIGLPVENRQLRADNIFPSKINMKQENKKLGSDVCFSEEFSSTRDE